MKRILIAVLVLLALVGGGLYFLHSNLDSILKSAIQKYGSEALDTSVRLKNIHIMLTSGDGTVEGLSVANPSMFYEKEAFNVGSAMVSLDINSLNSKGPIIIKQIKIDKAAVSFEINNKAISNLSILTQNAKNYASSIASSKAQNSQESKGPARKVIINDLVISNAQLTIVPPFINSQKVIAALPTIHLTGLGRNSGGATVAEVAEQILSATTAEAARVASQQVPTQIPSVKDVVGEGKNILNDSLKNVLGK